MIPFIEILMGQWRRPLGRYLVEALTLRSSISWFRWSVVRFWSEFRDKISSCWILAHFPSLVFSSEEMFFSASILTRRMLSSDCLSIWRISSWSRRMMSFFRRVCHGSKNKTKQKIKTISFSKNLTRTVILSKATHFDILLSIRFNRHIYWTMMAPISAKSYLW